MPYYYLIGLSKKPKNYSDVKDLIFPYRDDLDMVQTVPVKTIVQEVHDLLSGKKAINRKDIKDTIGKGLTIQDKDCAGSVKYQKAWETTHNMGIETDAAAYLAFYTLQLTEINKYKLWKNKEIDDIYNREAPKFNGLKVFCVYLTDTALHSVMADADLFYAIPHVKVQIRLSSP
jgi:hypothetical protein